MIDIIIKGGIIMWPIAFLGLIALAIIIERYIFFKITEVSYLDFKAILLEKNLFTKDHTLQFFETRV